MTRTTRRRPLLRRLRRALRALVTRPFKAVAFYIGPRLYLLYMRFVFATSRIQPGDFPRLHEVIRERDGAVGLLWHEEVFTVAYGYHHLGFRPHTLASLGGLGEMITRMLLLCGFVVFRGGSSRKSSRRRGGVLGEMIEHMKTTPEVIYGITVDGSMGPPYRMKPGGLLIARECGRPVVLARTWYRRCLRLPSWDRTAIPLPWNEIRYYLRGPYEVPRDDDRGVGLRRLLLRLEDELIDLAALSYRELGQEVPANLAKRTPAERERLLRQPQPPPGKEESP